MNYKDIKSVISGILFEYNYRTGADHSAGKLAKVQKGADFDTPLQPDAVSQINPLVSRPPVEDSNFSPSTSLELSAAVKALSELLSGEQIAAAYVDVKEAIEKAASFGSEKMKESYDQLSVYDMPDDSDMPEEFRGGGYSIEEPEDDIEDEPQSFKSSKSSGEASLQDILDSGILPDDVKSISGAKSFEGKAKRNLAYRSIFGAAAVEKAMRYALDIWVGALKADGGITDEQAKGFLQNSKGAMQTTAFKSFFEMGFMAPALKPMRLARDKQVKKEMSNADVPPQLENMIFSQTVGLSPQNPGKIRLKLNREFPDMKMEEMDETTKKLSSFVKNNAKKFQQDYFKGLDLEEAVREAWSRKSTDDKIDITYAAMDDAIDFEDKAKKAGLR